MNVNIQDDILQLHKLGLLTPLLVDKTTKKSIMWGTDAYAARGKAYQLNAHITARLVTGENSDVIKTRARKELEQQSMRTRKRAEVFTPLRVCRRMIDDVDEAWFGRPVPGGQPDPMPFEQGSLRSKKARTWRNYVDSRRLEPACGEAPYLVSRYDAETGEYIPVENRIGILDRKLRAVSENAQNEKEWLEWALRAYQATYGYEFSGDNLLIARVNLLVSFGEHLQKRWGRPSIIKELRKIAGVIVWNVWQMDGLTDRIPYKKQSDEGTQMSLLDLFGEELQNEAPSEQPLCRVKNWRSKKNCVLQDQKGKEKKELKFDYIIGNPPYQEAYVGESSGANSVYDKFMEASYNLSDHVELITPGRFLFNAGSTSKVWNEKMLSDPHFKVLDYKSDSSLFFPNVTITGGVAITYRDATKVFGAIETFTAFEALNSIIQKIKTRKSFISLSDIAVSSFAYHFTDVMHQEHPEAVSLMSKGHAFDLKSNCFKTLSGIFSMTQHEEDDAYILGRDENGRAYRWIKRVYINDVINFDKYKVFLSKADGASGTIGNPVPARIVGASVIGKPHMGATESFLSIGNFSTLTEAENLAKYIKTRFVRTALGALKVTQDITPAKWKYVPLQDFTLSSDIDWSKTVAEIDQQLYEKYGLDEAEIAFIESHVKEMD